MSPAQRRVCSPGAGRASHPWRTDNLTDSLF
nr:MAG TPA: Transcriptional enhancer factor TEF-3, 65, YAP, Hippo pathway, TRANSCRIPTION.0A [Caudoviricetes sp.]